MSLSFNLAFPTVGSPAQDWLDSPVLPGGSAALETAALDSTVTSEAASGKVIAFQLGFGWGLTARAILIEVSWGCCATQGFRKRALDQPPLLLPPQLSARPPSRCQARLALLDHAALWPVSDQPV